MATITLPVVTATTHTFPTASTTFAACTWPGHCLGASCSSNDDCDNDWICANKICSPCCETLSSSGRIATPTSSQSGLPSSTGGGGFGTPAAIGIGVGAVALLLLCVAAGLWLCRKRRRRRRLVEAPDTQRVQSELDGTDQFATDAERKRLFATTTAELPSEAVPMELQAVELVELDAASAQAQQHQTAVPVESGGLGTSRVDTERDYFSPDPEQIATLRSHQFRFEEHGVSPGQLSPGSWHASPVSPEEQLHAPRSEISMSSDGTDHHRTRALAQEHLLGEHYQAYRPPQAEPLASSYMSDPPPARTDVVIQDDGYSPPPPIRSSVERPRQYHRPFPAPDIPRGSTTYDRGEYTFLRWPRTSQNSEHPPD